jgi:uncharacterized protein
VNALVEYIVKPLVSHPEDVSVQKIEGEASILLELRLNAADLPVVQGRCFRDIQQVLAIAGGDRKPVLELIEPETADAEE